ncbi:hypothetical protein V2J09_010810 [Rumex salicifolius]
MVAAANLSCSSTCVSNSGVQRIWRTSQQSSECRNLTIMGNRVAARGKLTLRIKAVNDFVSAAATVDPSEAQLTWQIVTGSLGWSVAGVVPFVVAGVEFRKRIAAQKKCSVCNGTGLVLRDNKFYFRCPGCGGFLPWQSWKRFFTG